MQPASSATYIIPEVPSPAGQQSASSSDEYSGMAANEYSISAFPPAPMGNGLGGVNVYRTHSMSNSSSSKGPSRSGSVHGIWSGTRDSTSTAPSDRPIHRVGRVLSPTMSMSRMDRRQGRDNFGAVGVMDFFTPEIFQIVLRNPTTAHRLFKFCERRACGENLAFLEKVDQYNHLLDQVSKILGEIHTEFTSINASQEINIPHSLAKRITADIKVASQSTIPCMEEIFDNAQDHIERLVASDIYPRFVKHQITTSAAMALSDSKQRYQGLGDCFCLTDPKIADNPILFASDGFVDVTGYSRRDIVPRNCRFLQGPLTDRDATKRLKVSIENAEETVELLLNYRKSGEPFWNLLYVSPLHDQHGNIAFFLGGQIDCSTTIHSCTEILKVLSLPEDDSDRGSLNDGRRESSLPANSLSSFRNRTNFFKSFRKQDQERMSSIRPEAGMEGELVDKLGKLNFKTQVEAFYTAYSKYLVLKWSPSSGALTVTYHSPSIIDLLCLNLPNGRAASIYNKDIFKALSEFSLAPSGSQFKAAKSNVRDSVSRGAAVSLDLGLMTGTHVKRSWSGGQSKTISTEEKYVTHWTPLKDEEGRVKWVVLTIAPK